MATCASCNAPIRWATTVNKKPIPLDAEPSEDGNVVFVDLTDRVDVLGPEGVVQAKLTNQILFMPHHATCPKADQHRKEKG